MPADEHSRHENDVPPAGQGRERYRERRATTIPRAYLARTVLDRCELVIDHPADILREGLAARVLACVLHTASQLSERPEASIDKIETLDPRERQRIGALNEPLLPVDSRRTVHGVFGQQASARGQSVALRWLGGSMTYEKLDRESTRMAQRLARNGVASGSLVAVALDRSPTAVVVLLAALECGAAYLPMERAFPAERLAFMLDDAGVSLLVTTAASQGVFPAGFPTLLVDGTDRRTASEAPSSTSVDAAALAYVMYAIPRELGGPDPGAAGIGCVRASQGRGLTPYRPETPQGNRFEGHTSGLRSVFDRLRLDPTTAWVSVRELGGSVLGEKRAFKRTYPRQAVRRLKGCADRTFNHETSDRTTALNRRRRWKCPNRASTPRGGMRYAVHSSSSLCHAPVGVFA
ncbi:MAG: AMP-binding protein [Vicinamibacterales bacterium]